MINFYFEDVKRIKEVKITLKKWIKFIINSNNCVVGNINYVFCSDAYLLNLNEQYLKHNYFTDILTFNYNEENKIYGDIYISIDSVINNSIDYNVTFFNELLRVIIHGVLHLIGFDDTSSELKKAMTIKEDEAIELYFKVFEHN